MKQVIRIDEFGRPATLRMPAGVGIDLRRYGPVTMQRISEIHLDSDSQEFYYEFCDGEKPIDANGKLKTWPTYEEAVQAEIARYAEKVKENPKFSLTAR